MNREYFAEGLPDLDDDVSFDADIIADALVNIYQKKYGNGGKLDPMLFYKTKEIFEGAINKGIKQSSWDIDDVFYDQLIHNMWVFSAFRTHKMQRDIAKYLLNEDGDLKPFTKFVKDVAPYIKHTNRLWLETEYNTAVLRAHQAADWRKFVDERDVLPNLEWQPSTSTNPGEDHKPYWFTCLPIGHKFWKQHRPGDRWNCKCSLRNTDKEPTPVPADTIIKGSEPQRGLESNPGTTGEIFSNNHPYYPENCGKCPFNKGVGKLFAALVGTKRDCNGCGKIPGKDNIKPIKVQEYDNGGKEIWYADKEAAQKADFAAIKTIARNLAKKGNIVEVMPRYHSKSEEYKYFYKELIGTKYENKCPDLRINGKFYEFEGFVKPWSKEKIGRMLSHGLKQSSRVMIDNTKGCSHRYLRKRVFDYLRLGVTIEEILVYEKGNLTYIYKKSGK